jgi:CheY-like chemotaxis protein
MEGRMDSLNDHALAGLTEPQSEAPVRILLVEDHEDTAALVSTVLGLCGCEVQVVGGLIDALKAVGGSPFAVIMSDLGLPDGTGLDLMRQLRSRGVTTPAIAMTGYGRESDIQQSHEAGFCEHLVKPVDVDLLQSVVTRVLATAG